MILAHAFLGLATLTAAGATAPAGDPLRGQIRVGLSADQFVAGALQQFDDLADGAGVITARDLAHRQLVEDASRRGSAIGNLLRHDLNGDLRVTAEEFANAQARSAPPVKPSRIKARLKKALTNAKPTPSERLMSRYDANKDGAIEIAEVIAVGLPEDRTERANVIPALFDTPLGKDGKLTRAEVKAFAQKSFNAVDADGDGRISAEEYDAVSAAAPNS